MVVWSPIYGKTFQQNEILRREPKKEVAGLRKQEKERKSLKTNRGKMDGNARQKRMENYNMSDKCTNRKIIKNNKMVGKRAGLKHKKTLEK